MKHSFSLLRTSHITVPSSTYAVLWSLIPTEENNAYSFYILSTNTVHGTHLALHRCLTYYQTLLVGYIHSLVDNNNI